MTKTNDQHPIHPDWTDVGCICADSNADNIKNLYIKEPLSTGGGAEGGGALERGGEAAPEAPNPILSGDAPARTRWGWAGGGGPGSFLRSYEEYDETIRSHTHRLEGIVTSDPEIERTRTLSFQGTVAGCDGKDRGWAGGCRWGRGGRVDHCNFQCVGLGGGTLGFPQIVRGYMMKPSNHQ